MLVTHTTYLNLELEEFEALFASSLPKVLDSTVKTPSMNHQPKQIIKFFMHRKNFSLGKVTQ